MSDSEIGSPLKSKREDILKECEKLITHFETKANGAKRTFQIFKYSSVGLTTSVAILSVLHSTDQWPQLKILIPVVSSIAALATILLAVTNAQEHWIQSRSTQQKLVAERILFVQESGIYSKLSNIERVQKFSEQVVNIWSSGHEQWEKATKLIK
jgi:hypothetical protein